MPHSYLSFGRRTSVITLPNEARNSRQIEYPAKEKTQVESYSAQNDAMNWFPPIGCIVKHKLRLLECFCGVYRQYVVAKGVALSN